jgi:hypothetical protein
MRALKLLKAKTKYILLAVALLFITSGVLLREEHRIVLRKAINICLECIGVG